MAVTHTQPGETQIGIGEAAAIAQLHPDTIRRAVKRGQIPFTTTPGGQYRFRRTDIEALVAPTGSLADGGDAA
ncbi:helix-turn-helix domain-containing protein [Microcella alkaliphila]|nr:helix-turn-helix domain-containing protein [Microcella alkaliphila]